MEWKSAGAAIEQAARQGRLPPGHPGRHARRAASVIEQGLKTLEAGGLIAIRYGTIHILDPDALLRHAA